MFVDELKKITLGTDGLTVAEIASKMERPAPWVRQQIGEVSTRIAVGKRRVIDIARRAAKVPVYRVIG